MGILILAEKGIEENLLDYLREGLKKVFEKGVESKIESFGQLPGLHRKRGQYLATALWKVLSEKRRDYIDFERILGVFDVDLYVPPFNFIFGIAFQDISLFSPLRLRQSFYGFKEDENLFYLRSLKEAVHELGHTYGLTHCEDKRCVMYFSNSIFDTDRKSYNFCLKCKRSLFRETV